MKPHTPSPSSSSSPPPPPLSLPSPPPSLPSWNFNSHAIPSLHLFHSQLHEASYSKRPDVVHYLLSHSSPQLCQSMISSTDPHTKNTPLLWACMSGCVVSSLILLKMGANIFSKNGEGKSALHLAVASGEVKLVRKIVKNFRILCEEGDEEGATPLHYASVSRREMVNVFVEEGISFLVVDGEGDCPLHWACRESAIENVTLIYGRERFLKDVVNDYGESPVFLACRYQEKEICLLFGVEKYSSSPTTSSSSSSSFPKPFLSSPSSSQNSMFFEKKTTPSVSNLWMLPSLRVNC